MKLIKLMLPCFLLSTALNANAETYTFDPAMLGAAGANIDMSLLDQGGQLPGTYTVDIILNGEHVDSREVAFSEVNDRNGKPVLSPCLDVSLLKRYGVKTDDYPGIMRSGAGEKSVCARLNAIPEASTELRLNMQQLILNVPQIAMQPKEEGIASQQLWDDGIAAFLMNYSASSDRTEYRRGNSGQENDSVIQLNPGFNFGPWRIRNATTWQKYAGQHGQWKKAYTYAQRGINSIKSRLTLGESATTDAVFDSIPFSGAMLATAEEMIPYNLRQFAPVVKGIARSQARVEVRQNGYLIYSKIVSPGPFSLTDLTVPDTVGNLDVMVKESDGHSQSFSVPYQTPAIALKEGYFKYSVMAGKYRPAAPGVARSKVAVATLMYGLPWNLTAFGGSETARHYNSFAAGMGVSMGAAGSLSIDASAAQSELANSKKQNGTAWRVRYNNELKPTNTTFTLSSFQHASEGYNTLSGVLDSYNKAGNFGSSSTNNSHWKSRNSVAITQQMGALGNFTLAAADTDYRNHSGHDQSLSVSYGAVFKNVSLTLAWSKNKVHDMPANNTMSLWLSVPLGRWIGNNVNANYQMLSGSNGHSAQEGGLNGRAFSNRLIWDVRQRNVSDSGSRKQNSSSMRMEWYGSYGQIGGGYAYSDAMHQMHGEVQGGLLLTGTGITAGQPLSDTTALVEAPGASGVPVNGWPGVRTDFRGYTILSSLSPYQENTVSLDPTGLADDAELTQTDIRVVPTKGAVIPAVFTPRIGAKALMTISMSDGTQLPFGTPVSLASQGASAGLADSTGQVYLTGLPARGKLIAKWGTGECSVNYHLPAKKGPAGIYTMHAVCS